MSITIPRAKDGQYQQVFFLYHTLRNYVLEETEAVKGQEQPVLK